MPIYKTGTCDFCFEESDRLLPKIGFNRKTGMIICGFACPKCRKYFDEKVDDSK